MLCHERLLFLQEHDDSSGSDYMRTLRCYLDNHCNVVQTARELFIHRSTLLYRLEKIKEILESDLSSPDEILLCITKIETAAANEAAEWPDGKE